MAEEIFTTTSPKAIEKLIEEWSSFTPASRALDGLTPEQAVKLREKLGLLDEPFGQVAGRSSLSISTDALTLDSVAELVQAHL